jgi:uncharacterized protein
VARKEINQSQFSEPATPGRSPGSPFVVGRPLRDDEPIFGREEAFRFIAAEIAAFNSVNVIGERRMGKTSLLNHLIGNQAKHFTSQPGESSLVLTYVDLQRGVSTASRFYGAVLRQLLARWQPSQLARHRNLADLNKRLNRKPEAEYYEFEQAIRELHNLDRIGVRPVILIDEFELLLEPSAKDGFPYPGFFNGLRSIIGDKDRLLAMIVASRRPLAEYFSDPTRPGSLTSTFPNYFQPFGLGPLDDAAASALLLQKSDHALKIAEAEEAKQWAGGHPCHLQVAGAAWYQAKGEAKSPEWYFNRREELKRQSCMVSASVTSPSAVTKRSRRGWLRRLLLIPKIVFWSLPLKIGQLVQHLGMNIHHIAAWLIGVVLIVLVVLLVSGVVTSEDVWNWLKGKFGVSGQGH